MRIIFAISFLAFINSSCATMQEWGDKAMFWKDDSAGEGVQEETSGDEETGRKFSAADGEFVNGLTPKEMELKQAKIWARLDEIENELRMHRAHIAVLEKGMKLGVVPQELLTGKYDIEKESPKTESKPKTAVSAARSNHPSAVPEEEKSGETPTAEGYKKLMTEAESYFRAGHYGKAIAVYEKVGRRFKEFDSQNSHRYWVALSWYKLKELEVAKDEFNAFIKSAGESPWLPRAHFYLARIDIDKGMLQSALRGFRDIVKTYPYDDTSEMAKMEIERIEQRL